MHKFKPKNMKKLDTEKRKQMMPPEDTLKKFLLDKEDIFADIGCGIGFFTIPASNIIQNNPIYALDISIEMLDELARRIVEKQINNIEIIKTQEYDLKLPQASITYAFMCNVLHEIEDKEKMIDELLKILRREGKLTIIEWQKKDTEIGPSINNRVSKEEVKALLEKKGMTIIYEDTISNILYGVVAKK